MSEEYKPNVKPAYSAEETLDFRLPSCLSATIMRNDHASVYQSVEDYVRDNDLDIEPDELRKAIETNELWVIHWYPHTPVGHISVAAATLDRALELANSDG